MDALVTTRGDVTVINLTGVLQIENTEHFHRACFTRLLNRKVVFNLTNLTFVGSTGIVPFLKTLRKYSKSNATGLKMCGVGSEFQKIFAANLDAVEIYDSEQTAVNSFIQAEIPLQLTNFDAEISENIYMPEKLVR